MNIKSRILYLNEKIFCKHLNYRCVHGDEINFRNGARAACTFCGKSLNIPLPEECYYTFEKHEQFK